MDNTKLQPWDTDTIGRVYGILDEMLYSLAVYREIGLKIKMNCVYVPDIRRFWITISDNALQMAAIHWCKVFGSKSNNKTYFDHFVNLEDLKTKLFDLCFEDISSGMRNFRDKFAVHEDTGRKPIPFFEDALKVVEAFDKNIREKYDMPDLPTTREIIEGYQIRVRSCLEDYGSDYHNIFGEY